MAEAIIRGIQKKENIKKENIFAFEVSEERICYMKGKYNITFLESINQVLKESDYIFLAIKPQVFPIIFGSDIGFEYSGTIISIMAGIDTIKLSKVFPKAEIIRTMPNVPALVGEGITGVCFSQTISNENKKEVINFLQSIGKTLIIEEKKIDALTGLSGSGPAFVFQFAEAMADAGVYCGLSRTEASQLAAQTIYGSAKMIMETGKHPGELKDSVTSPGGTTIEGIKALEEKGFKNSVMEAVISSYKKSKELK